MFVRSNFRLIASRPSARDVVVFFYSCCSWSRDVYRKKSGFSYIEPPRFKFFLLAKDHASARG